jgi:Glycosyltransferase family 87
MKHKLGLILLVLALFTASFMLMRYLQTILPFSLGVDLIPRWVGTKAMLDGISPYSLEARQLIWQAIYGSTQVPKGNPFGFYYPPGITTLLLPFVLLNLSLDTATVAWCALLWIAWLTALAVWGQGAERKLLVALLISGLLFRPAFSNYILGQFALFSVLMLIAAWFSFKHDKDMLAGVFGALALVKPSVTLIPLVLLFIFNIRKYKGLISFFITSVILYLPPTFMLGWWVPAFLNDIGRYHLENQVSWSMADIRTLPGIIWLLASSFLIMWGLYHKERELTLASALILGAILAPHTADYDLVVMIPLLAWLGVWWIIRSSPNKAPFFAYMLLIWFPWISLIFFMQNQNSVVEWYRFIWVTYPASGLMITILILLIERMQLKSPKKV